MSYILDALLKADQERQRNATPTLNSVHAPYVVEQPGPRRRWIYPVLLTLLGGGLLGGGMLFGIRPATSAPERTSQAQAAATPSPTAPAKHLETVTASPQAEPTLLNAPLSAAVAPLSTSIPSATAQTPPPPATVATMTRDKTPSHERRMASPTAPTAPAPSAETEVAASVPLPVDATPAVTPKRSNRILDIGELPPELRKDVEESVIVSGSSFSADNNERMAIINDRARRAGDEVVAGMKLETILPDGIVLNYKGYRFRTGMY